MNAIEMRALRKVYKGSGKTKGSASTQGARWAPPGGWLPWLVVAAVGGVLVLVALFPLRRTERDAEAGPLIVVDPVSVGR